MSRKCAGLGEGAGEGLGLSESFWGRGGRGPRVGLWAPELSPSSAGPGRPGLQDTDRALPSLGLGRSGGPARGLRRPGGSGASHAGTKPSPVAGAGPTGLPLGSPGGGRALGTPDGFKAGPRAGEEGAPPTQPSGSPSQVALSRVSTRSPWSGLLLAGPAEGPGNMMTNCHGQSWVWAGAWGEGVLGPTYLPRCTIGRSQLL